MTTAAKEALEAWWAWVRDPDLLKPRTSGKDCLTKAEEELLRYGDIIEAALQAASQSKDAGGWMDKVEQAVKDEIRKNELKLGLIKERAKYDWLDKDPIVLDWHVQINSWKKILAMLPAAPKADAQEGG